MASQKTSLQYLTVQEAQNASMGQAGAEFINDLAEHTPTSGNYVAIQCIEETIFATLTPLDETKGYGVGSYNGNSMASETIPAGMTIYGRWTTIDLASGAVIAYIG